MTSKPETHPTIIYTSLPLDPNPRDYVILQSRPPTRHHYNRRVFQTLSLILLLSLSIYLLFPSDPHIQLVRLQLNHIRVNTSPHLLLDLSLSVTLKVHNPDFFSLNYDDLDVSISYRGRQLGFVKSDGGKVRMRGSSYVDATLDVNGFEILHDIFYLIEDVAAGKIPFDTVSHIEGELGLLFFKFPIQAKVSCEVDVNPKDQTITHQNCYPQEA
ncbi:uncharacterized protein LOC130814601 isoform X3 [Amaranthus tricolor]|uniref:uncharacterized protein LOC130814601 isoform X3 n=1 Tax=Amaranthus tricolor TaxID=29722 RepID=UPI002590D60E|nr:uncharacterized protein LOC130814601 isoform X3 [Amaranthus tricolor]